MPEPNVFILGLGAFRARLATGKRQGAVLRCSPRQLVSSATLVSRLVVPPALGAASGPRQKNALSRCVEPFGPWFCVERRPPCITEVCAAAAAPARTSTLFHAHRKPGVVHHRGNKFCYHSRTPLTSRSGTCYWLVPEPASAPRPSLNHCPTASPAAPPGSPGLQQARHVWPRPNPNTTFCCVCHMGHSTPSSFPACTYYPATLCPGRLHQVPWPLPHLPTQECPLTAAHAGAQPTAAPPPAHTYEKWLHSKCQPLSQTPAAGAGPAPASANQAPMRLSPARKRSQGLQAGAAAGLQRPPPTL